MKQITNGVGESQPPASALTSSSTPGTEVPDAATNRLDSSVASLNISNSSNGQPPVMAASASSQALFSSSALSSSATATSSSSLNNHQHVSNNTSGSATEAIGAAATVASGATLASLSLGLPSGYVKIDPKNS